MAKLLVSIRSVAEARAAVDGGVSIIDIKEPRLGSLGRAEASLWSEIRADVPVGIPISVALGELNEWDDRPSASIPTRAWSGISYRKIGLSAAGQDWRERWRTLRRRCRGVSPPEPAWIAVIYADWQRSQSPDPDSVIDAASEFQDCLGVLIDTWDKSLGPIVDRTWQGRVDRIRGAGRMVALAGGLDVQAIARLKFLEPDIFAVRGAACRHGDRLAQIDPDRVAALVEAAR